MTFAEYFIEVLTAEDTIWLNNWFGTINDLPNRFSRLMPGSVIFQDDLKDEGKNCRVQDLLKGTARGQGILAFMLIIMRIDETDVDKASEKLIELHARRTQKATREQSASASAKSTIQRLRKYEDYIFPGFDYASCSQEEMTILFQFLKDAFLDAVKPCKKDSSGREVNEAAINLDLQPFTYEKFPNKLKEYIKNNMGEAVYKEQFAKAIQVNEHVRDITSNVKAIVTIHDKPEAYKWHLYGFANIYEIVQMLYDKYYAGIPKLKVYQASIINGLHAKGLLFIRYEYLSYFLSHLFEKINFKNIENEISNAINPQYFEDLEKRVAKLEKQQEPTKGKFSRSLSSSNLQSAVLSPRQSSATLSTPIVDLAVSVSTKHTNISDVNDKPMKSDSSPKVFKKDAFQKQFSEKIKDGTLPPPSRTSRTAGSLDSNSSASIVGPIAVNLPVAKSGIGSRPLKNSPTPLSPPSVPKVAQPSPRLVESPGRKPRSQTNPLPAAFMSELNNKIAQQAASRQVPHLSPEESKGKQVKP